ncbi:MAG: ArsB/NhaD family transporter [Polyangiales bacterium]
MDVAATSLDANMYIAAGIMLAAYVLIFSEVLHRASAAIIGAVVMIGVGMARGFYSEEAALAAIDANTIFLLLGMMLVVAMLRPTGAFEYAAVRLTKLAGGRPILLMVYLGLAVSVISMFLDNVTTIIMFAPLTVLITRILKLNPMPYLVAEAMLSNIGGAATLVGDPPNIMIGSAGGLSFNDFLLHMGWPIAIVWVCAMGLLMFLFRRQLTSDRVVKPIDLDEGRAIRDMPALKRILVALGLIIVLFFTHHRLHMYPAFAAFVGLALALALLRPSPDKLFGELNWSVLVFFTGLFIIVGGVEGSGLLDLVGYKLAGLAKAPGELLSAALLLMWISAALSAVVDNIPFTVAMIPIIGGLETQGVNITPLWWALAFGVALGGNGTHIAATANIIVVTELENCGIPGARVTPRNWLRFGLPVTFLSLVVASLLYATFFDFFL